MELKHLNLNIQNKSLPEKFQIYCDKLKNLDIKMDNETKLKFYGLYKVATIGKFDPKNSSSSILDFQAKYKKY
jgi:acyl-CoA-binding protein